MLNLFIIALVFSAYICYNVIVKIELGNSNAEKEGSNMPIKYKKDILAALKEKGYSSTRIRNEKNNRSILFAAVEARRNGLVENN